MEAVKPYLYIPDISYHLVFCFLTLPELSHVARCNKEWRRRVITPSFLSMFPHHIEIQCKNIHKIEHAAASPFRQVIHKMIFLDTCRLGAASYLVSFPRLLKLDMDVDWMHIDNADFDITLVFQSMPFLQELKVSTETVPHRGVPLSFAHFQVALGSLKALTFLDFSPFQYMRNVFHPTLISSIRSLTNLTYLNIGYFDGDAFTLEQLCLQPGAPINLKHVGQFCHWTQKAQEAYALHLNKLPSLQTIGGTMKISMEPICTLLNKYVQKIAIFDTEINNKVVETLFSFTSLKSISLEHCKPNSQQLNKLITGLSYRLEELCIINDWPYENPTHLSFSTLSLCSKLKTIQLFNVHGLYAQQCDLLLNLKQLTTIRLAGYQFHVNQLEPHMKHALTLPSKEFPMLKTFEFW
jgi:hypothetical protein